MTPAARLSAAIEVFAEIEARRRPAGGRAQGLGPGASFRRLLRPRRYCGSRLRRAAPESVVGVADGRGKPARRPHRHAASRARPRRRGDRGAVQRCALCAGAIERGRAGGAWSAPLARRRRPFRATTRIGSIRIWRGHLATSGPPKAQRSRAARRSTCASIRSRPSARRCCRSSRILAPSRRDGRPLGLRIRLAADAKSPAIHAEPVFRKGEIEIQDEGSQLAALFAGAKPGEQVIDLAPAPAARRWRSPRPWRTTARSMRPIPTSAGWWRSTTASRAPAHAISRCARRGVRPTMLADLAGRADLRADRRAVHRHRHLAAQSRRQVADPPGRAGRTHEAAGSACSSARCRWSSRAAASPTSPVRCSRRKMATRCGPLSAGTRIFPWKSPLNVINGAGRARLSFRPCGAYFG